MTKIANRRLIQIFAGSYFFKRKMLPCKACAVNAYIFAISKQEHHINCFENDCLITKNILIMKNLESFGVEEMDNSEINQIQGGWINYVGLALAYFAYESAANPKASADAFMEGWNSAK